MQSYSFKSYAANYRYLRNCIPREAEVGIERKGRTPPNECPTLACLGAFRGAGLRWLPWPHGSKACQRSCLVGQGLNFRGQLLDCVSVVGFGLLLARE